MAESKRLQELRQQAQQRQRAATQKVSRLRRVNGVEVGGTQYDPRVPASDIRRMNAVEVKRYTRDLDAFMARGNRFEAGANMKPIPQATVRRYRAAEAKNLAKSTAQKSRISNIALPNGTKIGDAIKAQEQERRIGTRHGTRAYMDRKRNTLSGVMNAAALEKLTRSIQEANGSGYITRHREKTRLNMIEVLEKAGSSSALLDAAKKLSPYQVDVLWNFHPSFATTAGEQYAFVVKNDDRMRSTTSDAAREEWQLEQVEWASQIREQRASRVSEERPQPQGPRGRRR